MMEINKIYNENCLETMKRMDDCFIDLTVTSPPYDGLRDYNGYSFPFEDIAKELFRVTKDGGIVVWNVSDSTIKGSESLTSFKQAIFFVEVCGFRLHDTMIFEKKNFVPLTHNRYEQCFEYMFVLSKGRPKTTNLIKEKSVSFGSNSNTKNHKEDSSGGYAMRKRDHIYKTSEEKIRKNIFAYATGNRESGKHVAPFPQKLAAEHIISWSNKKDLVYDCFMGSGTTAKMAHIYKRNWIGSEISKEYTDLSNKRLKPYLTQTTLF